MHLLTWLLVGGWLFMAVIAGGGLAIILLLGDNKPAATK
jgi:hypothetical protein